MTIPPPPPALVVHVASPAVSLVRGGTAEMRVTFRIREGYHVQAHPVEDPNLIPTTLTVTGTPGLEVGSPRYPAPTRFHLAGFGDLPTFEGTFEVRLPLLAGHGAKNGLHRLKATLRYQACTGSACLAPRSLSFVLPVRVIP